MADAAPLAVAPRLPMRTEPWPRATPARDCPVCGTWWRPWTGSLLPCHTRCLFSREDRRTIARTALARDGRPRRLADMAREYGITESILRSLMDEERDGK